MIYEVRESEVYLRWFDRLADSRARTRITARIDRLKVGLLGDVKSVGGHVSELRIDFGPGYRVYFTTRGGTVIVLLCGGDKKDQRRDIARAKILAAALES